MEGMWLSKADLYQDLGVSSDVDVIKNRPRQRVIEDNGDLAAYLLYGSKEYPQNDNHEVYDDGDHVEPDLNNITSMVQMVKEAEELPSRILPSPSKGTTKGEQITITKSRLNPDVSEFVPEHQKKSINRDSNLSSPRNKSSPSQGPSSSDISSPRSGVSPANIPSSSRLNTENSDQDVIEDLKVNMDAIKEEDKDQIARILKEKYKSTKQDKTKRNVAINTLMKLYSSKSPSKCSNATSSVPGEHSEVQLLKPDDFLRDSPRDNIEEVDPFTKQVSITKVNKWLDSSSKSSSVEAMADTIKSDDSNLECQKSTSVSTSSTSSCQQPSTSAKTTTKFKKYVPSSDINKKIERLNKMVTETQKEKKCETVWDRAMSEMKAIDEKKQLERIKKKFDEEKSSSNCE